jgi:hypothetical protein
MRKIIRMAAIASLTVGGWAVMPVLSADQPANRNTYSAKHDSSEPFTLPAGITQKNLNENKDITSAFGAFEKHAVNKNDWSGIKDCLVDQDRTRMDSFKQDKDHDALNDVVAKIQGQWKAKYNQDFDVTRAERQKAFSGIEIATGMVDDPMKLAGKWPVAQGTMTAEAQQAASKQDVETAKNKYFGGDVNLDKGREVAIARVPGVMGLPEVRCSLIKEHTAGWRFDIPNNIDGQKLHDNLVKHLTMVADHPEQWPSDVDQAYGLVGHHALMALYDVEMPMADHQAK